MFNHRIVICLLFCIFSPFTVGRADPTTQPAPADATESADPQLPVYAPPDQPLQGKLLIGGSGTMGRLIDPLAKKFAELNPGVENAIRLQGSATTPPGIAMHQFNVGLMSRQMKPEEKAAVKQQTGQDPIEVIIAYDAILILVNKDNPVAGITLPQLDALYGAENRGKYDKPLATWSDLGVQGSFATASITPYGTIDENQGTEETFRRLVLLGGPPKPGLKPMADVTVEFGQAVSADATGISWNIFHPPLDGARAIPVAAKDGDAFVAATTKTLEDGSYPLTRGLYLYLADKTDPLSINFVKFILSRDGQQIIADQGVSSLSAGDAAEQRNALEN